MIHPPYRTTALLALLALLGCSENNGSVPWGDRGGSVGGDNGGEANSGETGSDEGAPGTAGNVTVSPDLNLIENDPCFVSAETPEEFDDSLATIVFHVQCDPNSVDLTVGQVVVGETDGGYLRRIESLEIQDSRIVTQTSLVSLAEVLQNTRITETLPLDTGARTTLNFDDTTLYADDDFFVKLKRGNLEFDPDMFIDWEFDALDLTYGHLQIDLDMEVDMELFLRSNNGMQFSHMLPLGQLSYPFTFAAGPVPVVGELKVELQAGFWTMAPGAVDVTAGSQGGGKVRTGAIYHEESGWTNLSEIDWATEAGEFDVEVVTDWNGKLRIRAQGSVSLYKTLTGTARAEPYIRGHAEAACEDLNYDFHAGLDTRFLAKYQILKKWGVERHFPVKKWEVPLYENSIPWPWTTEAGCGQTSVTCGETVSYNTTSIGSTSQLENYSCGSLPFDGSEYVYWFNAASDVPVQVEAHLNYDNAIWDDESFMEVGRKLFVLEDHGEGPDANSCISWSTGADTSFVATAGTSYWLAVDSAAGDGGTYDLTVSCAPVVEDCGNELDDDADGAVDCSDDDCDDDSNCNVDNGDDDDDDDNPGDTFAPGGTIACGDSLTDNTALSPLTTDAIDAYTCNVGNYSGPELAWQWTATTSGPVVFSLQNAHPTEVNHDLMVLHGSDPAQPPGDQCVAWGLNEVEFEATAGQVYTLVADGYDGDSGPVEVTLDCTP
ncbi:MAG TPA: hypothetical protein DIU15_08030 [Deltaproteobacteria bacterium]|nr:hypothetical protein [Deltaproteobacteria bacterium]HCP45973.1 hypothetical protein [Deltaproteobacteria bacterium]